MFLITLLAILPVYAFHSSLPLCLFYSCEWSGVFYPVLPGWGSQELILNPRVLSLLHLTCWYHTSRSQSHTMLAPAWTTKETCGSTAWLKFSFCVCVGAVEHHQPAPGAICQQVYSAQSAKILCSHLWLRKSGQRQKEEVKEFVIKGLFPLSVVQTIIKIGRIKSSNDCSNLIKPLKSIQ